MDQQFLERVDAWLAAHRQEIIDDLTGLVKIPSVSIPDKDVPPFGQACRDALAYMANLGQKHGYRYTDFDHYVGSLTFSEGEKTVGIWSHLDVVPVEDPADWDYPPFDCTLVDDRYLIGRGVQDNKMTAIAVLHVMNCLRDLGVSLKRSYALYMGTSEETGMEDARYFAAKFPCPDLSLVPDTGFPVCTAQRGSFTLQLSIPCPTAIVFRHTNNPSVTAEAVTAQFADGRVLESKGVTCSVTEAAAYPNAVIAMLKQLADVLPESSAQLNTLAELCTTWDGAKLNMAYADERSGALAMAPTGIFWADNKLCVKLFGILPVTCDVDQLVSQAKAAASVQGVDCTLLRARRPCALPTDHPVIPLLTNVYNEVTGYDSKPFVMTGGNYAAYIPNAFGFGPGMPGREFPEHIFRPGHGSYHQCDESEDMEHILAFMRIYAMSILALDESDA